MNGVKVEGIKVQATSAAKTKGHSFSLATRGGPQPRIHPTPPLTFEVVDGWLKDD